MRTLHYNKKKLRKTRKIRGGNDDNSGYILAGFTGSDLNNTLTRTPIFLLKERSLKERLPHEFGVSGHHKKLFIPVLYELNFRGLNLFLCNGPDWAPYNIFFYDEEEQIYPTIRGQRFGWGSNGLIVNMNKPEIEKIKEIELKYPGLFTRMFITKEQEQNALQRIQQ